MSAIGLLTVCILGCDALLYFLFQWTYGERHRGLGRKSRSNHATGYAQHSQPLEMVSSRSQLRFAELHRKSVRTGHENVTPIRRAQRLASQALATSHSKATR